MAMSYHSKHWTWPQACSNSKQNPNDDELGTFTSSYLIIGSAGGRNE